MNHGTPPDHHNPYGPDYHHHHHHHTPKCPPCKPDKYDVDCLRLEAVTVCSGFDDLLDYSLTNNHCHLDTMIVVTAHDDEKTQQVCKKHGVICVPTDLVKKNGRSFNKGAAINAGFNRFQWHGWRLHVDADILFSDNFRRQLFNHTCLERDCIYGADRVDVLGEEGANRVRGHRQHNWGFLVYSQEQKKISARYVDGLIGYVPIGYFQMWHASHQHMYPWSLGSAAHDDVCFAMLWPECKRKLIPNVIVHHMVTDGNQRFGNNWEGRKQPRLAGK